MSISIAKIQFVAINNIFTFIPGDISLLGNGGSTKNARSVIRVRVGNSTSKLPINFGQLIDSQLDLRQQYADKLGGCLLIKDPCPPQGTVTFPPSECVVKAVIGNDKTGFPPPSVLPMANGVVDL